MASWKGALAPADRPAVRGGPWALNSAPKSVITSLAGFAGVGSVINSLAGFAGARPTLRLGAPGFRRLLVCPNGLAPDVQGSFVAPQRRSQTPSPYYLLSLFLVQDVAHIDGGYRPRVEFNVPSDGLSLAGFQVIMYGRF